MTSPLIPPAGIYQIAYNDKTLTYDIPDQTSAVQYIALAVPTITLNDNGTMNKIAWEYKLGGGSGDDTIDPESLISQIELQIDGNGTACDDYPDSQGNRIYNSGMLTSATVSHTLTCQDLLWSNVTSIYMAYNDIFGNHIVVTWDQ